MITRSVLNEIREVEGPFSPDSMVAGSYDSIAYCAIFLAYNATDFLPSSMQPKCIPGCESMKEDERRSRQPVDGDYGNNTSSDAMVGTARRSDLKK